LNQDRSFQQQLIRDGKVENAEGSWRRLGEGGISFSKEFLKVSVRSWIQTEQRLEKRKKLSASSRQSR
jgi:hypothetical protein